MSYDVLAAITNPIEALTSTDDARGNRTSETDAEGNRAESDYDLLDRVGTHHRANLEDCDIVIELDRDRLRRLTMGERGTTEVGVQQHAGRVDHRP